MADARVEEDWTALDDLVSLHTAPDAGELHRRLLCFSAGSGKKADAFEPWCLFEKVRADESEGAVATAVLLLRPALAQRHRAACPADRGVESGLLSNEGPPSGEGAGGTFTTSFREEGSKTVTTTHRLATHRRSPASQCRKGPGSGSAPDERPSGPLQASRPHCP
ncbi:MAG TPA: hypothetical protein VM263_02640 [Acidimicrobiales bacterium]|nr:hypothetical protein [Acidimicrobiales bacterium]